uniref:Uncharacterized protein n=1 Tax=Anguilla anguilla TaxID=7936 RepID=A0A0E9RQB7_ANGAN
MCILQSTVNSSIKCKTSVCRRSMHANAYLMNLCCCVF